MAKRTSPKASNYLLANQHAEEINRRVSAQISEEVFLSDGMMATVQYADGTFKKKPTFVGQEFFFVSVYFGARETPIFRFKPVDKQEWEYAEFGIAEIDKAIPLFAGVVAQHLDLTHRRDKAAGDLEEPVYLEDVPSVMIQLGMMIDVEVQAEKAAAERKKQQESEELAMQMQNNSLWGKF